MIIIIIIVMHTAPGDYTSVPMEYTFMPGGDTRLDIPVTIINDTDFEGAEQFLGRLSTSANAIIDVPMTTVNIYDDDRKYSRARNKNIRVYGQMSTHSHFCADILKFCAAIVCKHLEL